MGKERPHKPPGQDVPEETGWEKLPPPRPGDWLYVHPEPGQTFQQFKELCRGRKAPAGGKIYLVPLGDVNQGRPERLAALREFLQIYYGAETVLAQPLPLDSSAYRPERRQYDASALLEGVSKGLRADSLATLALTDRDLYVRGLNFVFGLGSLGGGAAVYSLARFGAPDTEEGQRLEFLRTLKVAAHEIGHALYMQHCTAYTCAMNGSNSLPEMDARPIHLCPVCLKKLEWYLGLNLAARYRNLADFFRQHGLEAEAEFCERCAAPPAPGVQE